LCLAGCCRIFLFEFWPFSPSRVTSRVLFGPRRPFSSCTALLLRPGRDAGSVKVSSLCGETALRGPPGDPNPRGVAASFLGCLPSRCSGCPMHFMPLFAPGHVRLRHRQKLEPGGGLVQLREGYDVRPRLHSGDVV